MTSVAISSVAYFWRGSSITFDPAVSVTEIGMSKPSTTLDHSSTGTMVIRRY